MSYRSCLFGSKYSQQFPYKGSCSGRKIERRNDSRKAGATRIRESATCAAGVLPSRVPSSAAKLPMVAPAVLILPPPLIFEISRIGHRLVLLQLLPHTNSRVPRKVCFHIVQRAPRALHRDADPCTPAALHSSTIRRSQTRTGCQFSVSNFAVSCSWVLLARVLNWHQSALFFQSLGDYRARFYYAFCVLGFDTSLSSNHTTVWCC